MFSLEKSSQGCNGPGIITSHNINQSTYQADENAYELNHVGVSHGIEAPEERVENSDAGREDDCYGLVQVKDDTEGCAWK